MIRMDKLIQLFLSKEAGILALEVMIQIGVMELKQSFMIMEQMVMKLPEIIFFL